jgi:uncharacterized protein (DUF433 family)/predicted nuclease of predicted toxin-antitoxin system
MHRKRLTIEWVDCWDWRD